MNCIDGSDEQSCEPIEIDEDNYIKAIIPCSNKDEKHKLKVHVWFDVMDVVEVNEPEVNSRPIL